MSVCEGSSAARACRPRAVLTTVGGHGPSHRWPAWALAAAILCGTIGRASAAEPVHLVVMDPLSLQLACNCVQGYAQRDYKRLGQYLQKRLQRPVEVSFAEDLVRLLRGPERQPVELVIGKDSVVRADSVEGRLKVRALARLTGSDGSTTLQGLFVVRRDDRARQIKDLAGYQIFFGPAESVEKHGAALAALSEAGVKVARPLQTRSSCSDAGLAVLETSEPAAAVISSYAIPLLEGCGTVHRGALRVIGRTEPVPFVTAFATGQLSDDLAEQVRTALLALREQPELLAVLESKNGFVEIPAAPEKQSAPTDSGPPGAFGDPLVPGADVPGKPTSGTGEPGSSRPQTRGPSAWPGWRGAERDNLTPWLPDRLPARAEFVWRKKLSGSSLAGLAASADRIIVSDKDPAEEHDVWRCLDTSTGRQLWEFTYRAAGQMEYGNAPRATPLIDQGRVYLLSALGDLHCVSLDNGKLIWKQNLLVAFHGKLPTWGICCSPLLADGRLIVGAGGLEGSLAALNPASGKTIWQGEGKWTAYASPIAGSFGGMRQIIAYDADSLGGWDVETGERLWRLVPEESGDFNVPTPVAQGDRLLVFSENNGTRLHAFGPWGVILPRPVARHVDLAPDSATPVVVEGRVYGCHDRLYCLDVSEGLKELWTAEDPAFDRYTTILGSPRRLLITSATGELLLVAAGTPGYQLVSRLKLFGDESEVMAQPALVGTRYFVRSDSEVVCLDLDRGDRGVPQTRSGLPAGRE